MLSKDGPSVDIVRDRLRIFKNRDIDGFIAYGAIQFLAGTRH